MRICVLGVGKMGSWLAKELSAKHELAIYDNERAKMERFPGLRKLAAPREMTEFRPEMLINAVSLPNTLAGYRAALPYLASSCILADVASIKNDLADFYRAVGLPFVSIHPMFGPTFANVSDLRQENVVLISESQATGKEFYRGFFAALGLNVFEFSFAEHDRAMAYSLTLPFVSSLVFSSCVSSSAVPGTTFRRHLEVARGLLGEDDVLLSEILFNPHSLAQLDKITGRLNFLRHIIAARDGEEACRFLNALRENLKPPPDSAA